MAIVLKDSRLAQQFVPKPATPTPAADVAEQPPQPPLLESIVAQNQALINALADHAKPKRIDVVAHIQRDDSGKMQSIVITNRET